MSRNKTTATDAEMELMHAAVKKAIEKAGGPKKVGDAIGISGPAVSQWRRCPGERVPIVSKLSGMSRYALRPDLYERRG